MTPQTPAEPAEPAPQQFTAQRLRLVHVALVLSWLALALLVLQAIIADGWDEAEIWVPAIAAAVILVLLSFAPWNSIRSRQLGDALVVVWALALAAGLFSSSVLRGSPVAVAYAMIVVLGAALVVGPVATALIGAIAVGGFVVAYWRAGMEMTDVDLFIQAGVLVLMVGFTILLAGTMVRYIRSTQAQVDGFKAQEEDLQRRQRDLERVYEVSRTIGAGRNLAEVLPELVGRVVDAVGAKVGLVLLYVAGAQSLEVISPIWVAGQAVRAEGYLQGLTDPGLAPRVFISGQGDYVNGLTDGARDGLLDDLDAQRVAAVPLRLEAQTIGVLMVTDKEAGDFDRQDLELLESLAAPSALILEHMTRFEEAQETSQQMAELARLKTDFVSVVSHELRTPLTSIIGSLATLNRPQLAPTDPGARELLLSAQRQADRLKRLIEDLLTVSRLDNRSLPLRPESIELQTYIRELVRVIPGADAAVTLDLSPELPLIQTDPEHLRRIVTNLIENSLKYAQGAPVECVARLSGREVWISVVDHGPGIPYEFNDHIFERFTQVGPHETRVTGGTGLGLSIVRGLSEAMGGRVWYEPTLGGGATFTVALPVAAPAIRTPMAESA